MDNNITHLVQCKSTNVTDSKLVMIETEFHNMNTFQVHLVLIAYIYYVLGLAFHSLY